MSAQRRITRLSSNAGSLALITFLAITWYVMQRASAIRTAEAPAARRTAEVLQRAAAEWLHPGDQVFLSSSDTHLRTSIEQTGAMVIPLDPLPAHGVDAALSQVLDENCTLSSAGSESGGYWIWNEDAVHSPLGMGELARKLSFVYRFQAVLSPRDDEVLAIDKMLELFPRQEPIQSYCAASKMAAAGPVLVILDHNEFSPWIGSVTIGRVTWVADSAHRNLAEDQFAVRGIPPFLFFDVYWMGQVPVTPRWSFVHQDARAYAEALARIRRDGGMVLVDRQASLGPTSLQYLRACTPGEMAMQSETLVELCIR